MENVSMTLPPAILSKYRNDIFIETGSYDGRTIQMALDCGFPSVRSIELGKHYYDVCVERFIGNPCVTLYHGDSVSMLWQMIADITVPVTFWLDAHIQEGVCGPIQVPILKELEIIAEHPIKTHTILIDDRRLLGTPGSMWGQINEFDIIRKLRYINPSYNIFYEDNNVTKDDIIVAKA